MRRGPGCDLIQPLFNRAIERLAESGKERKQVYGEKCQLKVRNCRKRSLRLAGIIRRATH
jgi:hypothetical protein